MPIPIGILAASAFTPIVATGGTIVDANGWRHHVFNSSGTLSVTQGSPTIAIALMQNGGGSGTGGGRTQFIATRGGNGGNSGDTLILSSGTSAILAGGDSITVTVGGALGASSVSPLTPFQGGAVASWNAGGGAGGEVGSNSLTVNPYVFFGGSSPGTGTDYTTYDFDGNTDLYNGVKNNNSGGGGGRGRAYVVRTSSGAAAAAFQTVGAAQEGGTGGSSSYRVVYNGGPAGANSGGGGGGGGASLDYSNVGVAYAANGSGGVGGSGYVIISYPLSSAGL